MKALILEYLPHIGGVIVGVLALLGLRYKWRTDAKTQVVTKFLKDEVEVQKKIIEEQGNVIKSHQEINKKYDHLRESIPNHSLRDDN